MSENRRQGILLMALTGVLWSTGGLFIKLLPFNAYTILFYRSIWAAVVFAVIHRKAVLNFRSYSLWVSLIFTGLVISFVVSTKLTTSANAIFLQYMAPVYVLLYETLVRKVKMQRINLITLIVCMIGLGLFFLGDFTPGNMNGNLLAILSGFLLAALLLTQHANDPDCHASALFGGNVLVALIGLPFFLQAPTPTLEQFAMLSFLGIVQIGIAYALFNMALKHIRTLEVSLLGMIEPILNPVWVYLGYGERPSNWAIAGGLLILAALSVRVIVLERSAKRQVPEVQARPSSP